MDKRRSVETRTPGRAFRISAAAFGILLLLLTVPFAIGVIVTEDPAQTIHRYHVTSQSVSTAILAAALLVLAWRPDAVAAFQLFVAGAIVSVLVGLLAGDLFPGLYFVGVLLAAILFALYPWGAEALRVNGPRVGLISAAVLAGIPAIAYALTQASLQRHGSIVDPHVEMHHYSGVALAAVALPATALVAAIGDAGWRIVGWIAACASVLFGWAGVAFSTYPSAPESLWSWASVAGGVVVLVLTEFEARRSMNAARR
jgi:hypothetical protein